jgi:HSP20 family protein
MRALDEVKGLYQKVTGQPAPEVGPHSYTSFPPGADPALHAVKEVDQLKKMTEQMAAAPTLPAWVPPADTLLAEDAVIIRVEVPGVARDDLKVFAAGGQCIVRGERKPPMEQASIRPMALERPWGRFERRFVLPPGSHPEQLHARLQDGVLELRITADKARTPVEMKIEVE